MGNHLHSSSWKAITAALKHAGQGVSFFAYVLSGVVLSHIARLRVWLWQYMHGVSQTTTSSWGLSNLTMQMSSLHAKEVATCKALAALTARLSTLTMMSSDNQGSSFRPLWLLFVLALAAARPALCFSKTLSLSISCSSLLLGRTVPGWANVGLHHAHSIRTSG